MPGELDTSSPSKEQSAKYGQDEEEDACSGVC